MKRYQCFKQVDAFCIAKITMTNGGALMFSNINQAKGEVTFQNDKWYNKHKPKEGGYFVKYDDGYCSYSPAEAFESGYNEIIEHK